MPRRDSSKATGNWTTGYKIPEVIETPDFVEFCFRLPNDPVYQDAFWQHMDKLCFWHGWEHHLKTGAKDYRAKEAAHFWSEQVYLPNRDRFELGLGCGCTEECEECEDNDCVEYLPSDAFIKWLPSNPFAGKNDITPGYKINPFAVAGDNNILGLDKGDVYVSLTNVMYGMSAYNYAYMMAQRLANGGLPRFQFTFVGKGEVELHLTDMPQGGFFWIHDMDKADFGIFKESVSVSAGEWDSWIEAIAEIIGLVITGDITHEQIVELTFEEAGEHRIEVVFMPKPEFPNILESGWGGGLHKIVACGGIIKQIATPEPEIREGEGGIEYHDVVHDRWILIPGSASFVDCCDEEESTDDCECLDETGDC